MQSKKTPSAKAEKKLSHDELQNVTGERVSKTVIDQATPTHALIDEMDMIDVESTGHRELVVTSRIKTALTSEQGEITTLPTNGQGQRYASVTSLFGKVYAQMRIPFYLNSHSGFI